MLIVLFLLMGLVILTLGLIVYQSIQRSLVLEARVKGLHIRFGGASGALTDTKGKERDLQNIMELLSKGGIQFLNAVMPTDIRARDRLSLLVRKAGFLSKDGLSVCLAVKIVGAILGMVGAVAMMLLQKFDSQLFHNALIIASGAFGLVAGAAVPEIILEKMVESRQVRIVRELPNALDLMIVCLTAGMTFERTLQLVAKELSDFGPDLARELRAVGADLRAGKRLSEAMRSLYDNTGVESLRSIGGAVVQGRKFGSSISESIEKIAEVERDKREAMIEEKVQKIPTKLTLPTIGLVVPGMMALVGGPSFLLATQSFG